MNHAFREIIEDCPVIATVKDMESLEKSFETDSHIIRRYLQYIRDCRARQSRRTDCYGASGSGQWI